MVIKVNPTPFHKSYHPKTIILYVEGDTDRIFFNSLDRKNYEAKRLILGFFKSRKSHILDHISNSSDPYEYGLVDKDFDDSVKHEKLFYTDTHDLETLLLSNDNILIYRIFKKHFDHDIDNAKYMAYQIGVIKKTLFIIRKEKRGRLFLPNNVPFQRSLFTCDYKLIFEDFCSYFERINNNVSLPPDIIKKEELIRNNFSLDSASGKLIFKEEKYVILQQNNLWDIINGHDILKLLKLLNNEINECFTKDNNFDFEHKLVEAFQKSMFINTILYFRMKTSDLFN